MVKLIYKSGPFGDCTSNYDIQTDATTVAEFIEQVLKERSGEHGQFCIHQEGKRWPNKCVCSYDMGAIKRKATDFDAFVEARIKSISANGGWSAMGYDIAVEDFDSLPEQSRKDFEITYWGYEFPK